MPELFYIGDFKHFRKRHRALDKLGCLANPVVAPTPFWIPRAALSDSRMQVAAFVIDPGETTGWSIMALSAEALVESDVAILGNPADGGINFWAHGQVDCGAKTGNAGVSGTRGLGAGNIGQAGQLREIPVAAGVHEAPTVGKLGAGPTTPKSGASGCTERLGGSKRGSRADTGLAGGTVDLGVSTNGEASGVSELMGIYDWACTQWGQNNLCVLIEDFIPRKPDKSRQFLSPVRITAQVDYCLWLRGAGSWRQSSVDAGVGKNNTSGANDSRLQAWGFYTPRISEHLGEIVDSEYDPDGNLIFEIRRVTGGKGAGKQHARDADRHAITWFRRCKAGRKAGLLRAECWPGAYRS